MPSYSKTDVLLVSYPFTDQTASKVRPAAVVGVLNHGADYLIVPLTSRTSKLGHGEFVLQDWKPAGLHVETVVKQGIYTVHGRLVLQTCRSPFDS